MATLDEATSQLAKKHESLKVASSSVVSYGNKDLLSELTDNFHSEHTVHRAAADSGFRNTGPAVPTVSEVEAEAQAEREPELEYIVEEDERKTGQGHRRAAVVPDQKLNTAADQLYKKHEALRSTGVVETRGGNKDLLSEITDNFHTDHLAQRAVVEHQHANEPSAGEGGEAGTKLVRVSGEPTLRRVSGAPQEVPKIGRTSIGAVHVPPVVDAKMSSAAGALAAKHEELRANIASSTPAGYKNHDLLSEVTDNFHKEHTIHRAAVDTKSLGKAPDPPSAFAAAAQAGPASSVRRASMGSSPLNPVAEKKAAGNEGGGGFFKKIGRLFSGKDQETPKGRPALQAHSLKVASAAADISTKSRGLSARTSMTPTGTTSASPLGSGAPSRQSTAPPPVAGDMLGTLCDEWHVRNSSAAAGEVSARPAVAPTANLALKASVEHAQLEY